MPKGKWIAHWLSRGSSRTPAIAIMVLCDLLSLGLAAAAGIFLRQAFDTSLEVHAYLELSPVLLLFPVIYALMQLYPGSGYGSLREMRALAFATSAVFVMIAALIFLLKISVYYSRLAFLMSWAASLITVPAVRAWARRWLPLVPGWAYPVVVFGSASSAAETARGFQEHPELGFRAVAVVNVDGTVSESLPGMPVLRVPAEIARVCEQTGAVRAVICPDALHSPAVREVLETQGAAFTHLYVVSDLEGLSSLGVEPREVGNSLALEVRRNLLLPSAQITKRVLDLAMAGTLTFLLLPVLAVLSLLVRFTSPGPVFYSQRRLGRGGREFSMWKFRTMRVDGDRILREHLARDAAARSEWDLNHKLRNDPRVTPVGNLLRRTSLDELPQLWNVIRGDMSLVGPRPIVREEVAKYGRFYRSYERVLPGLTGLWQVSGRSKTTYARRVELDAYYVRNWSPLVDLTLLVRTVKVVLRAEGAY